MSAPLNYKVLYDMQDASQLAHFFERTEGRPTESTALCGAPRPSNCRSTNRGSRPPNRCCPICESVGVQRGAQLPGPARFGRPGW